MDTHSNSAALAERHVSETPDGRVLVQFFGPYDALAIVRRLDFGLQFLFQAARNIHGAFRVPAPQIDELAARLDRMEAERIERHQRAQAASKPGAAS